MNPLPTLDALHFSIVPSAFLLTRYTHFVSTIRVPSRISDLLTLVNTRYFSTCACSLVLTFAYWRACGEEQACWSVGWSGSAPTANIDPVVSSFCVAGYVTLIERLDPTSLVHCSAVFLVRFFGAAEIDGSVTSVISGSFCVRKWLTQPHQDKIQIASSASRAIFFTTPNKRHREVFRSHLEVQRGIWRQSGGIGRYVALGRHQQGAWTPTKPFLMQLTNSPLLHLVFSYVNKHLKTHIVV